MKSHSLLLRHSPETPQYGLSLPPATLLQLMVTIQEEERERLARELHDTFASRLHRLRWSVLNHSHPDSLDQQIKEMITVVRLANQHLHPADLAHSPLFPLLSDYLAPLYSSMEIDFIHHSNGFPIQNPIIKKQLFSIFQEVVSNCLKHAEATALTVHLRISRKGIILAIQDNGRGFIPKSHKGSGLRNIQWRIELLQGISKLKSTPGKGTSFILFIPQNDPNP